MIWGGYRAQDFGGGGGDRIQLNIRTVPQFEVCVCLDCSEEGNSLVENKNVDSWRSRLQNSRLGQPTNREKPFHHSFCDLPPGASLASRQRELFPKKSLREAWRRAWKDSLGGSREFSLPRLCKAGSLTSPLSPRVPRSTFPSTLLPHRTLWHDWVTHPFSVPHLRSLPGTTGDVWSVQLATPALSAVPQVFREGLEHLPETLARGALTKGRRAHSPLPLGSFLA